MRIKMKKLNSNKVALSLSATALIVYLVCLVFVAVAPLEATIAVSNSLFHGIDLSGIATKRIELASTTMGLIITFAGTYVIGYLFAAIYNLIGEKAR